jgi:predicted extracellular nuclease
VQAEVIGGFVAQILACEPQADVMVLGNANDLPNTWTLAPLPQQGLQNLVTRLPLKERYTTVVEGNSAAYQHAYITPSLFGAKPELDVVHLNAEFAAPISEHDPLVVRLEPMAATQLQPILFLPYIGLR